MTINQVTAKDDLAFMRALVTDDGAHNRKFGLIYFSAGFLYGVQCLVNFALLSVSGPVSVLAWLVAGWLPTILFLIILFFVIAKERKDPPETGTTKRAISAAFSGAGVANLVLALVFAYVAYKKQDWSIWFLFPVVVCALQGAIWFAIAIMRRSRWYGVTAIAWFISAILLGGLLDHTLHYVLALGLVLFICMALPGLVILKSTSQNR